MPYGIKTKQKYIKLMTKKSFLSPNEMINSENYTIFSFEELKHLESSTLDESQKESLRMKFFTSFSAHARRGHELQEKDVTNLVFIIEKSGDQQSRRRAAEMLKKYANGMTEHHQKALYNAIATHNLTTLEHVIKGIADTKTIIVFQELVEA